ncbi:unnamed protein product, partial [Mesorhabditis spiculigera]
MTHPAEFRIEDVYAVDEAFALVERLGAEGIKNLRSFYMTVNGSAPAWFAMLLELLWIFVLTYRSPPEMKLYKWVLVKLAWLEFIFATLLGLFLFPDLLFPAPCAAVFGLAGYLGYYASIHTLFAVFFSAWATFMSVNDCLHGLMDQEVLFAQIRAAGDYKYVEWYIQNNIVVIGFDMHSIWAALLGLFIIGGLIVCYAVNMISALVMLQKLREYHPDADSSEHLPSHRPGHPLLRVRLRLHS